MDYFLLRRFNSLLNVFAYAYFIGLHLSLGSSHLFPKTWTFELVGVELVIFVYFLLSLLFVYKGSANFINYTYFKNWLYFLQIITLFVSFIFITYYLWNIGRHDYSTIGQYFSSLASKIFYIIGIISVIIHFAGGLRNSLYTWGITVSQASQKVTIVISWFIVLCLVVWSLVLL